MGGTCNGGSVWGLLGQTEGIFEECFCLVKQIAEEKRAKLLTEPFTVTNISAIIDQIENWRNWFGNIQPYYALKAQNNPVTRRIFHQLGLGYDCASLTEMEDVLSTGCDPRQIVVSHPYKSYHCISEIIRHRMLTVLDSKQEADKMMRVYNQLKEGKFPISPDHMLSRKPDQQEILPPAALIRIKPSEIAKDKVASDFSKKFGVSWKHFEELVQHCKSKGVPIEGLSFHPGIRASDAEPWTETISVASWCWNVLESHGYKPTIIDIGGGFRSRDDTETSAKEIACLITDSVEKNFHSYGKYPKVIAEPGAFMVGKSQSISMCVMGKQTWDDNIDYHMSCGIYNGLLWHIADPLYEAELNVLTHADRKQQAIVHEAHIWGVSCDGEDDLGRRKLPVMSDGDWVTYPEVGDYCNEFPTLSFNGFFPPEVYYCCEERHTDICRRLFGHEFDLVDKLKI